MVPLQATADDIALRVRAEFLEMPGLRLTRAQAQRLWGLEQRVCEDLLARLLESHFLSQTRDGSFVLSSSGR